MKGMLPLAMEGRWAVTSGVDGVKSTTERSCRSSFKVS